MRKRVSNKQKNQPYNTRVGFDDKIYIARNKTSIPPPSQGAVDDVVKYKPITENFTAPDANTMVDNAINVIKRHLEHYKNSPNKEILNREALFNATEALEDERIFDKFHEDDLGTFFQYAEAGRKLLNNEINENKKNMKQIRISESTLRDVIRESVKKHLKEYRQEYSSMSKGSNHTIEIESEDELEYTIVAQVTVDEIEVDILSVDLLEGSYDPAEIEQIEAELSRDYDKNMDKIRELAIEMDEDERDNASYGDW